MTSRQQIKFKVQDGKLFATSGEALIEIGDELKVTAFAHVVGDQARNFALIRLRDYDGAIVYKYIARRELVTNDSIYKALTEARYFLPPDTESLKLVARYIKSARPKARRVMTHVTGWHQKRFVLPGQVIGQTVNDNPKIRYIQPEIVEKTRYGKLGSLGSWKSSVAGPAACSPIMVLGISAALAAPLIGLCNLEGGGWHLQGPSSKGKTISLLAARSVAGEATRDDLEKWTTTINAVEAIAYGHNHSLICIDDTDQLAGSRSLQAETMRNAAHKLANGAGKRRLVGSSRGVVAAHTLTWKTLVLSNGMKKLAEIVRGGGDERATSEIVRFCDLPAVTDDNFGVFSRLPEGCPTLEDAFRLVEAGCTNNYGTALPAFLSKVVAMQDDVARDVTALMVTFEELAAVRRADSWEVRFAKKFAVAYAAGILGARFNVLPWQEGVIESSILDCYQRARMAVPNARTVALRAWNKLVEFTGDDSKVVDLREMSKAELAALRPATDVGFLQKTLKHGLHLVVSPEVLRSWFNSEQEVQLLIQKLDREKRLIRTDPRGVPTNQRLYPWSDKVRHRYYFIAAYHPTKRS